MPWKRSHSAGDPRWIQYAVRFSPRVPRGSPLAPRIRAVAEDAMTRRVVTFVLAWGVLLSAQGARAQPEHWFELAVPGSRGGVWRAAGLDPRPDRGPRFVRELIRELHGNESAVNARASLRAHLDNLRALQRAWLRASSEGSLRLATSEDAARSAEVGAFLDLLGFELVPEVDGRHRVVPASGRSERRSARFRASLAHEGIPVDHVSDLLNGGGALQLEIPTFTVQLPLAPDFWIELLLGDVDGASAAAVMAGELPASLFARVVTGPDAAALYLALSALDAATLAFLEGSPGTLTTLYSDRDRLDSFARYGRSLRVREGEVVVPGGAPAASRWESIVGESPADPARFLPRLTGRDRGQLAYFYDAIAGLPLTGQRFALSLWDDRTEDANQRFRSLWDLFRDLPAHGDVPGDVAASSLDPVLVLRAVRVDETGAPAGPAFRSLWEEAFREDELPEDADEDAAGFGGGPLLDAEALLSTVLRGDFEVGRGRLDAFLFAQRVFGRADPERNGALYTTLRGFARYPMLMLTLERMGITAPDVHATTVRAAAALSDIRSPLAARASLSQFQGAVALLERLRRVGALGVDAVEDQLRLLAAAPLDRYQSYQGGIADWLHDHLLPVLELGGHSPEGSIESALLEVLAGARGLDGAPPEGRTLEWEGLLYEVDRPAMVADWFRQARAEQGGADLDLVLLLSHDLLPRVRAAQTVEEFRAAAEDLVPAVADLAEDAAGGEGDEAGPLGEAVESLIERVRRIDRPGRLRDVADVAVELGHIIDFTLAAALRGIAYAVSIGEPSGATLGRAYLPGRHDFGLGAGRREVRMRAPWSLPVERGGTRYRIHGSLLSLDTVLARFHLPRVSNTIPPEEPVFPDRAEEWLVRSLAYLNPYTLADGEMRAVATAIRRGRDRLGQAARGGEALAELLADLPLGPHRERDLRWTIAREPEALSDFPTLGELYWLGAEETADLGGGARGWGAPSTVFDGCLCLGVGDPAPFERFAGRAESGILAARFLDLQLRPIEVFAELGVPAALLKDVLPLLLRDFLDGARPAHADDWLHLARYVRDMPVTRIEDYVSSLVGRGPLYPTVRDLRN